MTTLHATISPARQWPDESGAVTGALAGEENDMAATILIAEDERDIRDLVAFSLRFGGFEVVEATNGQEAVDKARQAMPDLILMDVRMPKMTGYEACKKLKSMEDVKH